MGEINSGDVIRLVNDPQTPLNVLAAEIIRRGVTLQPEILIWPKTSRLREFAMLYRAGQEVGSDELEALDWVKETNQQLEVS